METRLRPIKGFGWRGWCLLPVLAGLVYCAAGGFDLRFFIMQAWYDAFGWMALVRFVVGLTPYGYTLLEPICGPLMMLYVLPAMHLLPRRWAWWEVAVILGFLLIAPKVWWLGVIAMKGSLSWLPIMLAQKEMAVLLVVFAFLVGWMMRSVWVGVAVVALGAVGCFASGVLIGGVVAPNPVVRGVGLAAWHGVLAGVLIGYAVQTRRRVRPGACRGCGYDLGGLAAGVVCPECGGGRDVGEESEQA